jgi:antitoxin ParD1/3/4
MHISIPTHMEEIINNKVKSGLYSSVSEVVREALRVWIRQEQSREMQLQELCDKLQSGIDQFERGESRALDKSEVKELIKECHREYAEKTAE